MVDTQIATLTAVDYDGNRRTLGGDPVTVKLISLSEDTQHEQESTTSDVCVIDHKNGQYTIRLRSSICGRYAVLNK